MAMAEVGMRHCQFCDLRLAPASYPRHLREQHRMTSVRLDTGPEDLVSCMFCLETVPEVEYPGHVFHQHRITGLYLGDEGAGSGGCQESKYVQTCEDEQIFAGDEDKQKDEDSFPSSNDSAVELTTIEPEHTSAEVRPTEHETREDSEESDFELDCQCSFCLHADMDHVHTSLNDIHLLEHQEAQPDDSIHIPTDEILKPRPESPTPKKVTFANITNYYPVKKLRWLERLKLRGGKNIKSQILGPDTTLRSLKYWGSSEKPRADPSDMRKSRRPRRKNRGIDKESEISLRSLGVAVVWHCPKDGCQFTGRDILTVRKHFSSHFPSK